MTAITQNMFSRYFDIRGVAVLPVMILIGAIIIEIAIVGGVLAFYNSTSNLSVRASQEALFTARSGAQDAILKLIRDKDLVPVTYSLPNPSGVSTSTAQINISAVSGGIRIIVATSTVSRRTKTVKVVVNIDGSNGKIDIVSFSEEIN